MNKNLVNFCAVVLVTLTCVSCQHKCRQQFYYPSVERKMDSELFKHEEYLNEGNLENFFARLNSQSESVGGVDLQMDSLFSQLMADLSIEPVPDSAEYITLPETIKLHYHAGKCIFSGIMDDIKPRFNAADTLVLTYTPRFLEEKNCVYINDSIYKAIKTFLDGNEENADKVRKWIPIKWRMNVSDFHTSLPEIDEIHFFENGIVVYVQESESIFRYVFFPADGSNPKSIGGYIE